MYILIVPYVEHVIVGLYMDTNIACRQCMQQLTHISAHSVYCTHLHKVLSKGICFISPIC